MELQDAKDLIQRLIATDERHQDYAHVCELEKKYRRLTTGKDVNLMLRKFARREDDDMFQQRVDLTRAITPAVAGSVAKPFNKVVRSDRAKFSFEVKKKANRARVERMIAGFYGAARSKNKGLDYWMKDKFRTETFLSPNSWVAVEWKAVGPAETPKPYPFLIKTEDALNFQEVNGETQWVFVQQDIKVKTTTKDPTKKPVDAKRYTLYDTQYTIVYEEVHPTFYKEGGVTLLSDQEVIKVKSKIYIVSVYEPKIGFAPVFRIGYIRDPVTEDRTCVNPWHDALCFFEKSLKTVSELDISMTLHAFPQKIQYQNRCPGPSREQRCNAGRLKDDSECPSCKGTGWKMHTSGQDALTLSMPDDPKEMLELEKLIAYKYPPIDLLKWQNQYVLQLDAQVHSAVFNSQMFAKKAAAATGDGEVVTATEIDVNMQSIYDTLEPFTEQYSNLYREIVTVMCILVGENPDDVVVTHTFPSDFKLKTVEILLSELKAANDSGAPSFLKDAINTDIASIVYNGDPLGEMRYKTKRRFFPFNGKTTDEIQVLMQSRYVSDRDKILYANFDAIFAEIEAETPEFFVLPTYDQQYAIVEEKVAEWTEAIMAGTPDPAATLRSGNPARTTGANNGGDNPGNDDGDDADTEGGSGDVIPGENNDQ